jgi:hypothetical protein
MDLREWHRIVKLWNKRLASSGFNDIEQFSPDCSGRFSAMFYKDPQSRSITGSGASVTRRYNFASAEFYRRLGVFVHHAPLRKLFKGEVWRYKGLLKLWASGATSQEITEWLNRHKSPTVQLQRSIYWVHYRLKELEVIVNKWWNENEEWLDYEV